MFKNKQLLLTVLFFISFLGISLKTIAQEYDWEMIKSFNHAGSLDDNMAIENNTVAIVHEHNNAIFITIYEYANADWTQKQQITLSPNPTYTYLSPRIALHNHRLAVSFQIVQEDHIQQAAIHIYEKQSSGNWSAATQVPDLIRFTQVAITDIDINDEMVAVGLMPFTGNPSKVQLFKNQGFDWGMVQEISVFPSESFISSSFGREVEFTRDNQFILVRDAFETIYTLDKLASTGKWYIKNQLIANDNKLNYNEFTEYDNVIMSVSGQSNDQIRNLCIYNTDLVGAKTASQNIALDCLKGTDTYNNLSNISLHQNRLAILNRNSVFNGGRRGLTLLEKESGTDWTTLQEIWTYNNFPEGFNGSVELENNHMVITGQYYTAASVPEGIVYFFGRKERATIEFPNQATKVGNTITLNATSNSTGAVTYEIVTGNSIASLNGTTLVTQGAGEVQVKATVASTSNYSAASATATITIEKADAFITNFGGSIIKYTNNGSFALEGVTNSDAPIVYSLMPIPGYDAVSVSGTTATIVKAGSAFIKASVVETANYKAATDVFLFVNVLPSTGKIAVNQSNSNTEIKVYPNPVQDFLTISYPSYGSAKVRIFNVNGEIVFEGNIQASSETINLEKLPQGLYFIEINTGEQRSVEKIIKN